jgi:hypothetical protein
MPGTLRYNPARDMLEAELPDGTEYGPEDYPDDNLVVLADPNQPDNAYLAVLEEAPAGLTANTLYKLTPVSTLVEEVEDFEDDEEDEDETGDEEEDDEEEPAKA